MTCELFAPTEFAFTFETEEPGAFSQEEIGNMVTRDDDGHLVSLNLPYQSVFISNHQVSMKTTPLHDLS